MKKLITLTLLTLSFNAFSSTGSIIRLEGQFEYADLSVTMIRDVEVVPQQKSDRMQKLMEDGYECHLISTFYKCQKFIKDLTLPGKLSDKISGDWSDTKVLFKKSASDPELVNDAESLQEWDVYDSVSLGFANKAERADMYRYYLINSDLHKLKIETESDVYYPLVLNEKQLSFPVETSVSTGRFNWKTYNVDVVFRKK